jgi:GR25 family glycosyltransferase involved in LPS biosynthesis
MLSRGMAWMRFIATADEYCLVLVDDVHPGKDFGAIAAGISASKPARSTSSRSKPGAIRFGWTVSTRGRFAASGPSRVMALRDKRAI